MLTRNLTGSELQAANDRALAKAKRLYKLVQPEMNRKAQQPNDAADYARGAAVLAGTMIGRLHKTLGLPVAADAQVAAQLDEFVREGIRIGRLG